MDWRKTSAPTLAVLVGLCALALFFGMRALTSDLPGAPVVTTGDPTCSDRMVTAGSQIVPADVLVSVFNGGSASGVASKTMAELVERGFAAGDTGNVDGADVRFVQVWADDPDSPAVQLVARQFGARTRVVTGQQLPGVGVVVVVGNDFEKFGRRVAAVSVKEDTTICSPPLS